MNNSQTELKLGVLNLKSNYVLMDFHVFTGHLDLTIDLKTFTRCAATMIKMLCMQTSYMCDNDTT